MSMLILPLLIMTVWMFPTRGRHRGDARGGLHAVPALQLPEERKRRGKELDRERDTQTRSIGTERVRRRKSRRGRWRPANTVLSPSVQNKREHSLNLGCRGLQGIAKLESKIINKQEDRYFTLILKGSFRSMAKC